MWIHVYGVATISRLLKMIGLFCRISSLLYCSFATETYDFKEPTNRSHPIPTYVHPYMQMNLHVSIYIKIHMYVYIYPWIYMYIYTSIHTCICVYIHMYIHIQLHLRVCICMNIYLSTDIHRERYTHAGCS